MNFQQKYLKYKSKYLELKNQLKGGACNTAPIPTDNEYISFDQYQDIPVARLETIGGHCYDIVQLANWIHLSANATYPATALPMNAIDKWHVINAYNAYRIAHDPALPNHFIFTPAQDAQINAGLAANPIPVAITNLIDTIRGHPPAPLVHHGHIGHNAHPALPALPVPLAPIRLPFLEPAQIVSFHNIIPVAPADLQIGTYYVGFRNDDQRLYKLFLFRRINPANGFVNLGWNQNMIEVDPNLYRFYARNTLITNGIPVPH
jgi:hypothetical protein